MQREIFVKFSIVGVSLGTLNGLQKTRGKKWNQLTISNLTSLSPLLWSCIRHRHRLSLFALGVSQGLFPDVSSQGPANLAESETGTDPSIPVDLHA